MQQGTATPIDADTKAKEILQIVEDSGYCKLNLEQHFMLFKSIRSYLAHDIDGSESTEPGS